MPNAPVRGIIHAWNLSGTKYESLGGNLPFEEEPDILIDGTLATENDIEQKQWDGLSKILTFRAKHFSRFEAVQKSPASGSQDSARGESAPVLPVKKQAGVSSVILSLLALLAVCVGITFVIRLKRRGTSADK